MATVRIDKWLWAARFYKTRALACEALRKGRVQIGGQDVKPSREVRIGDTLVIRHEQALRTLEVLGLSQNRGSAQLAQQLYTESPASILVRVQAAEQRRLHREPALAIDHGRPTKRDRRDIEKVRTIDSDPSQCS